MSEQASMNFFSSFDFEHDMACVSFSQLSINGIMSFYDIQSQGTMSRFRSHEDGVFWECGLKTP
jgi:hypothetical protein